MEFSAAVLAKTLICAAATLGAALLSWMLYRSERPHFGVVASYSGAIVSGSLLAVFLGVRTVIAAFQQMSAQGGGIGSTAAWLWEASQPLRFSLFLAALLGLVVAATIFVRSSNLAWGGVDPGRMIVLLVLFITVSGFVAASFFLYMNTSRLIIRVIDPGEFLGNISPAYFSMMISKRLIQAAVIGIAGFVVALACIPLGLVLGRPVPLGKVTQRVAASAILLLTLFCGIAATVATSWSSRLQRIAVTGSTR